MKVNKSVVVGRIQERLRLTGVVLSYTETEKMFDASLSGIMDFLKEGNEVSLEMGKFCLDYKKPRKIPQAFLDKAKGGVKNFSGTTAPYVTLKFIPSRITTNQLTNTPLLMGTYGIMDTDKLQRSVE